MAAPTLRSALNYYLQRPDLTEPDRAHLKRWLNEVQDPVWEQLAADIRKHGELPTFVMGPYSHFIGPALRARHFVESETDPLQRKRKQQREQQDCSHLVVLADKMEDVVRHYQSCKKAQHPRRVPSPSGPLPDLPPAAEANQSLKWLSGEALRLRQLAGKQSASEQNCGWDRIPVHVSRQSGGKMKRNRSREVGVFMQVMVNCMYRCCGKPRYRAVATITNIAFPDANVLAENVRSACRPTTRIARRRSGALSPTN
jgi:hypothetical protein